MDAYIATILWMATTFAPQGTLEANGQCLPVNNNNAAIYSLLGNRFGGSGGQTFCLPDLRPKRADGRPDDNWNGGPRAVIVVNGIYPSRP